MKLNKKGFTLVELLAVIVILAIIALIAVPITMNVIGNARKSAAIESFRGYMDAVEKTIIRDSLKTTSELPSKDANGCYKVNEINSKVKMKGHMPEADDEDDKICMKNGKVDSVSELLVNSYKLEYKDGEILINGKSAENNVKTIEITNSDTNIYVGETLQIQVGVTPSDANRTFTYQSSDTSKATVTNSGLVEGKAVGSVTITVTAKNGKKATKTITVKEKTLSDKVKVGDIIKMTPTSTSLQINSSLFDCSISSCTSGTLYTINPSQMKWWRVIDKKSDGTIDIVAEYVQAVSSGTQTSGMRGKLADSLQKIASYYSNTEYTKSTRYFGFNGQTLQISGQFEFNQGQTTPTEITPAGIGQEYDQGKGGDTLYARDVILLSKAKGVTTADGNPNTTAEQNVLKAYKLDTDGNKTTTYVEYLLPSRAYYYSSSETWEYYHNRIITVAADGKLNYLTTNGAGRNPSNPSQGSGGGGEGITPAFRPVLTLKANLPAVKSNESDVDWVLE